MPASPPIWRCAEDAGLSADASGVVVLDVKDAPTKRLFQKGDVILEVNGAVIADVATLKIATGEPQRLWTIRVLRGTRKLVLKFRG